MSVWGGNLLLVPGSGKTFKIAIDTSPKTVTIGYGRDIDYNLHDRILIGMTVNITSPSEDITVSIVIKDINGNVKRVLLEDFVLSYGLHLVPIYPYMFDREEYIEVTVINATGQTLTLTLWWA